MCTLHGLGMRAGLILPSLLYPHAFTEPQHATYSTPLTIPSKLDLLTGGGEEWGRGGGLHLLSMSLQLKRKTFIGASLTTNTSNMLHKLD